MVIVGELLLAAFFEVLFERLASHVLLNFVRHLGGGVDLELKMWENTLMMIQAVLKYAADKQLTDRTVRIWLDNLRNFSYDGEDILDEFSTKALERKLMQDHDHEAEDTRANICLISRTRFSHQS